MTDPTLTDADFLCMRVAGMLAEVLGARAVPYDGLNPFHTQTATGVMLELYYGNIHKILTPLGGRTFSHDQCNRMRPYTTPYVGGSPWRGEINIPGVELELHREAYVSAQGEHGGWYSVRSVAHGGALVELPPAALGSRFTYEQAKQLFGQWAVSQGHSVFAAGA